MTNRTFVAVGLSTLAFLACSSDAQTPTAAMNVPVSPGTAAGAGAIASVTPPGDAMPPMAAAEGGPITGNETWSDGKMLASNVEIAAGAKVQIAPGAQISVASGVTITVHGSLEADAKDKHAKLSGTGWSGIVIASGGSMVLRGVDIAGATATIHANAGDMAAEYDYGTITGGGFNVDEGGTFKTDHAAFVQGGSSAVSGTLNATFLDYSGVGVGMADMTANVFVADSKITGVGGDFFTASGAQLLHVEYTTIDNTHCPFHFNSITKFEIDHVTTGGTTATSTDAFGLMIYNPEAGPHTVSFSNFNDPQWDQTSPTTVINVTNTFIRNVRSPTGQITFTPHDSNNKNAQTAQNPDAHPRGTPGPG